jgi:hypothetical protein
MFNKSDISRDAFMLKDGLAECGYDWWWHSFTAHDSETGAEKGFFIEFFTCNPALGGEDPVFGQLPENQANDRRPSYLMVKAGTWGEDAAQLHRFFGWNAVQMAQSTPFSVRCGDCFLSETATRGHILVTKEDAAAHPEKMSDAGELEWALTIDKQIAYNVGFGASRPLREREAFEMFWHAEGMKSAYSGYVLWNGRKYLVTPETSFGYADKNWGKDFTSPWVWLSSNNLTSKISGKKAGPTAFLTSAAADRRSVISRLQENCWPRFGMRARGMNSTSRNSGRSQGRNSTAMKRMIRSSGMSSRRRLCTAWSRTSPAAKRTCCSSGTRRPTDPCATGVCGTAEMVSAP